jgi:HD-GYP domain-containing protein (c-di-GMP phosphodiesterase class II)
MEDPVQLRAAVYMHDVALAFLTDDLVLKNNKYDQSDIDRMQIHPKLSSDYVALIPGWENAAAIILQHHERWDGTGYPSGVSGEKIRPGAQILAIVDAYESITQPRPDRQHKRSVLRAVTEINSHSGTQFSPELVSQFIITLRDLHSNS